MAERSAFKSEMDRMNEQLRIIEGNVTREQVIERNWAIASGGVAQKDRDT